MKNLECRRMESTSGIFNMFCSEQKQQLKYNYKYNELNLSAFTKDYSHKNRQHFLYIFKLILNYNQLNILHNSISFRYNNIVNEYSIDMRVFFYFKILF